MQKEQNKEYLMGLSSSQARLLTLTARQHAVEYSAQRIEAQKLQLANESDQVYNTYLEKLDANKIQYKVVTDNGNIRYDNATFNKLTAEQKFMYKVGNTTCSDWNGVKAAMLSEYDVDITLSNAADSYTLLSTLIQEGYVVLMEVSEDAEDGYTYAGDGKIKFTNPSDSNDTNEIGPDDPDYEKYLYKVFRNTSISTSTLIQEVSDEIGLKKAEAQYEADMNRINAKDARYDTELSQLETERNAIKQEIDTLKTVAKDNVDRTFKIFT